jgi:hypothetical protein
MAMSKVKAVSCRTVRKAARSEGAQVGAEGRPLDALLSTASHMARAFVDSRKPATERERAHCVLVYGVVFLIHAVSAHPKRPRDGAYRHREWRLIRWW